MRSILALLRASWISATSYRMATLLSFVSLLASVVPVFFVTKAIGPLAQESIRLESGDYFGFVVIGIAATYLLMSACSVLPSVLSGSIGSGTFESFLVTRTPLPVLLAGLAAYPLVQALLRALLVVAGAIVLGVRIEPTALPVVGVIMLLMVGAYASIGLVAAALVLIFRTSGPLITAVVAGSSLLGGVYYSTTAIPGWLQSLSAIVPLTYALRATRRLLLAGAPLESVAADVGTLALIAAVGLTLGSVIFAAALRHARRAGTLSQH